MKDNGRTDEYAPDSTLDSVKPGVFYQHDDGTWFNVCVNDFVDLTDAVKADPIWGSSFQVTDLLPGQIVVRMYNPDVALYELVNVDIRLVNQNYQLSPFLDTLPEGAITL